MSDKLVLYRPNERPFDYYCVERVLRGLCNGVRTNLPGAMIWSEHGDEPRIIVRLNETADALWIDDHGPRGFELVSKILESFGEELILADLDGNFASVTPKMNVEELLNALERHL